MYTKGEYDNDLRKWQKELGNLTNDFEAVCKNLRYRNLLDTMERFREFDEKGLVNYPEDEYVEDLVKIFKQSYGIDMSDRIIKNEES